MRRIRKEQVEFGPLERRIIDSEVCPNFVRTVITTLVVRRMMRRKINVLLAKQRITAAWKLASDSLIFLSEREVKSSADKAADRFYKMLKFSPRPKEQQIREMPTRPQGNAYRDRFLGFVERDLMENAALGYDLVRDEESLGTLADALLSNEYWGEGRIVLEMAKTTKNRP